MAANINPRNPSRMKKRAKVRVTYTLPDGKSATEEFSGYTDMHRFLGELMKSDDFDIRITKVK